MQIRVKTYNTFDKYSCSVDRLEESQRRSGEADGGHVDISRQHVLTRRAPVSHSGAESSAQ